MNIAFPLHFNNNGRTAASDANDHVRDLIGQVLFTNPGERVNRPDFGCGLLQLVFEPNSDELAVTTQFLVQGSLQLWLGEIIEVNDVQVSNEESRLQVSVTYTIRRTQEKKLSVFVK